jgi:hypothetical protein
MSIIAIPYLGQRPSSAATASHTSRDGAVAWARRRLQHLVRRHGGVRREVVLTLEISHLCKVAHLKCGSSLASACYP